MKRPLKVGVILVVAVLLLTVALLVAANVFVNSKGVRARLAEEMTKRTGLPVEAGRIWVTPWSGVVVKGARIPFPEAARKIAGCPMLETGDLHAKVRLASLLGEKIDIPMITLRRPKLTLLQDQQGRVLLPWGANPAASEIPRAKPVHPLPAPEKPAKARKKRQLALGGFRLEEGSVRIYNPFSKGDVATLRDVSIDLDAVDPNALSGAVRAAALTGRNNNALENISFKFRVASGGPIEILDFRTDCAGGEITAALTANSAQPDIPFEVSIVSRDLDLDRLPVFGKDSPMAGRLSGRFKAAGNFKDHASHKGKGYLRIDEAKLRLPEIKARLQSSLAARRERKRLEKPDEAGLDGIADDLLMVAIDDQVGNPLVEHMDPHVDTLEMELGVRREKFVVDSFQFFSPDLGAEGKGHIGYDGKISFTGEIYVSRDLRREIPLALERLFTLDEAADRYVGPIRITKTLSKPRVRICGKESGRLLRELWE